MPALASTSSSTGFDPENVCFDGLYPSALLPNVERQNAMGAYQRLCPYESIQTPHDGFADRHPSPLAKHATN
ncbi:MAG: hypothetical protein LBM75_10230 [Myxococcales bacterium]|jgi:hypothetical protein|nr:hypothetical protein [Myxococcales bacterium]